MQLLSKKKLALPTIGRYQGCLPTGTEPESKVWGGKVWALKYIIIIIIINCIILVIKRENLG